ncbi:endonuclease/exonuclease/phosphatase family protein [Kordia sp. YSTF-M3]|uniref:Endonuclease/exonuclease/phosphatase family protein n=1 Tax=Kordia aestuariivivens TaxID=2759037 RepID=A0ABR7Q704_9FLAO|nr:endonuclease/exonuclease/phosphatase family protein [Kordia aestuariivivens]MBC8754131.1 endonuclease/exonuclease/phosphatase family protein [Kordia aestuariivivens]
MKLKLYFKKTLQIFLFATIIVHFTIKDTFYISSLLFYASPLPLIVLGLLFLLLFIKASARKYYAILAVVIAIIWVNNSYIYTPKVETAKALEVVLWNAYRTENFQNGFEVSKTIPDVMILIECDEHDYEKIKAKYNEYHFYFNDEAIGIFSKTPFKIHSDITSKWNTTVVHFSTKNIHFYAVDVSANVKYFRKPMLENVFSEIKTNDKTIVLGDFNTPFETLFFKNFKKNYQHAFTEKGNGFRETWFWNIPLLSLDHIWVSQDLEILNVDKISTTNSDHSMLKMYLKNDAEKK